MGNDDHGQVRHAFGLSRRFRKRQEILRDYRYSRGPSLLEFDSVVDTPRGAGASVTQPVDDDLALFR